MTPISHAHWTAILAEVWGILATLTRLDGEYDLNFRAETQDAAFILKVMRPDCDTGLVDMQVRAFEHIAQRAPDLPCPRVIRTTANTPFAPCTDDEGAARLV